MNKNRTYNILPLLSLQSILKLCLCYNLYLSLFVVYFVCHINAYKLAAFYLLYDWPNIHLKRLCNVSTLKHSPCPRLTVTPLNSAAFMLATSIRRIKGTCADKACVELACAIITARPCYLLSAPSEMRPGDFVSKSHCKDTTNF